MPSIRWRATAGCRPNAKHTMEVNGRFRANAKRKMEVNGRILARMSRIR